jgi:hypothetical protein
VDSVGRKGGDFQDTTCWDKHKEEGFETEMSYDGPVLPRWRQATHVDGGDRFSRVAIFYFPSFSLKHSRTSLVFFLFSFFSF